MTCTSEHKPAGAVCFTNLASYIWGEKEGSNAPKLLEIYFSSLFSTPVVNSYVALVVTSVNCFYSISARNCVVRQFGCTS